MSAPTQSKTLYRKGDYVGLKEYLKAHQWPEVLNAEDFDQNYDKLRATNKSGVNKLIPTARVKLGPPKSSRKFNSPVIEILIKKKHRLFFRLRRTG